MKIVVVGIWHLGAVTAACLAKGGHQIFAYDSDKKTINSLKQGKAQVFEPGLDDLLQEMILAKRLQVIDQAEKINDAEVIWINYDTPVNDDDSADIDFVKSKIEAIFPFIKNKSLVIVSSQLPVGSIRAIKKNYYKYFPSNHVTFACIPENLRLGQAINIFTSPDRFVVGLEDENDRSRVIEVLKPFTENIIWMSLESAEMTKHALNSFLALSVTFINEISGICEAMGANAREVEQGLKSESRIGKSARLRPGNPIAGGTLLRDVNYLSSLGEKINHATHLIDGVLKSNEVHKLWLKRKLNNILDFNKNLSVAVLGLSYKSGTNTLRRSSAIELSLWLAKQGVTVFAWDPVVKFIPENMQDRIKLSPELYTTFTGVDALIIATDCPEFKNITPQLLQSAMKCPIVLDPSGLLIAELGRDERIEYHSVGISTTFPQANSIEEVI